MVACYSCHALCENPKTFDVYYGVESFKLHAPGNYAEYNKKGFSERVVSDKVYICTDCVDKAGNVTIYKYAVKLWKEGISKASGMKCCHRCHHLHKSSFCNQYKYALPWWIKYFIEIDKIEATIDLGPVKHLVHCTCWKPLSSIDVKAGRSLKGQFKMGLYLFKYHRKIRKKLKTILFQDLFSFNSFADRLQQFLNSNASGSILDRYYLKLFYRPYRNMVESNIYKKYQDTRARLKDWAEALS